MFQFDAALCRGCQPKLPTDLLVSVCVHSINIIYLQVFEWSDNHIRSGMDGKYCYFHEARDAIELHQTNEAIDTHTIDSMAECLIKTTKIKTYLDILKIYLDNGIPFNIISSPGSGIRYIFH